MLWKALAVICAGVIVVFGGLPVGRLGGVASEGLNDYAQLWFCFGVGLGGLWGFTLKDVL
jgi:hypothetical protein